MMNNEQWVQVITDDNKVHIGRLQLLTEYCIMILNHDNMIKKYTNVNKIEYISNPNNNIKL